MAAERRERHPSAACCGAAAAAKRTENSQAVQKWTIVPFFTTSTLSS